MKIVVLAGGLSPERNVSLSSGTMIAQALERLGHQVALVDMSALTAGGAGLGGFFIWKALILAVLIFIGLRKLKWSPILFIAISAVIGIIFKF